MDNDSPVAADTIGGILVFVVKPEAEDAAITEWIAGLRTDHPPYPFGLVACIGSTAIFENDEDLDGFIEGWGEGVTLDA